LLRIEPTEEKNGEKNGPRIPKEPYRVGGIQPGESSGFLGRGRIPCRIEKEGRSQGRAQDIKGQRSLKN